MPTLSMPSSTTRPALEPMTQFIQELLLLETSTGKPVVLSSKEHWIPRVSRFFSKPTDRPFLIGVAGMSASGKTTFSRAIAQLVNEQLFEPYLTHLKTDNYYQDISEEITQAGGFTQFLNQTDYSFDEPEAMDLALLRSDLEALKRGETIYMPEYEPASCRVTQNCTPVDPSPIVIADGLYFVRA